MVMLFGILGSENHTLTHLDYLAMLKFMTTQSNTALKGTVEAFVCEISTELLERVCQNWIKRMDRLMRKCGRIMHEIILKH